MLRTTTRTIGCTALFAIVLSGCWEFTGELERIGFISNLATGDITPWHPDDGIALDTEAAFTAQEILDGQDDEHLPRVQGTVKGRLELLESTDRSVVVTGRSGVIRFDGEATDLFRVQFRPIHEVAVQDFAHVVSEQPRDLPQSFGVPIGVPVHLVPTLRDRRGDRLGWNPDQLDVFVEGFAATHEEQLVALEVGTGELVVAYAGTEWMTHRIQSVPLDAIVRLTSEVLPVDGQEAHLVHITGWTSDDLPVYGLPLAWDIPEVLRVDTSDSAGHALWVSPTGQDSLTASLDDLEVNIAL
jgi:hypothetical protein